MRFISTRVHGMLDYMMGILLIASPWIFGFDRGGAETWIPVILGAGAIIYSLLTDYELGASKKISMPTHLWLDVASGAFLAVSPWLFDFDEYVYLPHLILGLLEIGAGLMTKKVPYTDRDTTTATDTTTSTRTHNATIVEDRTRTADRAPMSGTETKVPTERDRADRDRLR